MFAIQPIPSLTSTPGDLEAFIATLDEVTPGVYSLDGIIPELTPDDISLNINAADTTNTDQLWAAGGLGLGLTGAGVDVGVWDGGQIRATHREFNNGNRVTVIDGGAVPVSDHATHVAGTIGARGDLLAARGMGDQVAIRSRDSVNDVAELIADAAILDLSNHSYGFLRGWTQRINWPTLGGRIDTWMADRNAFVQDPNFGKYTGGQTAMDATLGLNVATPQALDDMLSDNSHLLSVWAAGNDRTDAFLNVRGDNRYVAWWGPAASFALIDGNVFPPPGADGGIDAGFDILPQSQVAKNSLAVGAINDVTADPYIGANVAMSAFSSWGMSDDGRIKPDVVANGVTVQSSVAFTRDAFGQPTTILSDTTYDVFDGTSMAAPNVTGSAALLVQHYRNLFGGASPQSATTKGLLIHTAFDAGRTGPDYEFGWGVVDAAAAANFLTDADATVSRSVLQEATYSGAEWTKSIVSDGTSPLKISMVWTDPAPVTLPGAALDDFTPVLVNDLDLWITGPGGTFRPWTLNRLNPTANALNTVANHVDNVEQVLINAPAAGTYTIHVGRTGNTFTQDFSLLASGVDDNSVAPTSVDLANNSTYDTGLSASDNITNRDNSTAAQSLQFVVMGTIAGATVNVYGNRGSGPVLIGTAIASGPSTTVNTNGTYDIFDGINRVITATQTEPGRLESTAVQSTVTIDTQRPLATIQTPASNQTTSLGQVTIFFQNQGSGLFETNIDNFTIGDLRLTNNGSANVLPASQATLTGPAGTWTLGNLNVGTNAATISPGAYTLSFTDQSPLIQDRAGNAVVAGTPTPGSWTQTITYTGTNAPVTVRVGSLIVTASASGGVTLTATNNSITKTGAGTLTITSVSTTGVVVTYNNNEGATHFNVNTGSATVANWSLYIADGTTARMNTNQDLRMVTNDGTFHVAAGSTYVRTTVTGTAPSISVSGPPGTAIVHNTSGTGATVSVTIGNATIGYTTISGIADGIVTLVDDQNDGSPTLRKYGSGTLRITSVSSKALAVNFVNEEGKTEFQTNTGDPSVANSVNWKVIVHEVPGWSASSVEFQTNQNLVSLEIGDGAVASISTSTSPNFKVLTVGSLSIAQDGTLDVTNNGFVLDYASTLTTAEVAELEMMIRDLVLRGRASTGLNPTWTGTGITSSTAAAAPQNSRAVGYAVNGSLPLGQKTTFLGQSVDSSSILVRFTVTCDFNLDGTVNDDDVAIYSTYYKPGLFRPYWAFGDADYTSYIDNDDGSLLGGYYGQSV